MSSNTQNSLIIKHFFRQCIRSQTLFLPPELVNIILLYSDFLKLFEFDYIENMYLQSPNPHTLQANSADCDVRLGYANIKLHKNSGETTWKVRNLGSICFKICGKTY